MAQPLILIVEDDSIMANTLASIVQLLGYQTDVAHSSQEALTAATRQSPDLILLDLNLPDMDGLEVCRHLKRQSELAQVPVIVVSAEDSPELIRLATEAGAARYLIKPVGLDDLEIAIAQTIQELG